MPDWFFFEKLSGSPENNFEKLCRELVKRQFSSFGCFEELKNEPGIEFSVTLDRDNDRIGKAGEQIGWQCKWFQYNKQGDMKSNQRNKILHSLDETKKHYPNLKSWILWTHKELVKSDVAWFKSLQKNYTFKLKIWNQKDIDGLMTGNALELEQCFFEKLALTPEMLAEQHKISVAPVASRWIKEVHVQTDKEREIRMILGEGPSWAALPETGEKLSGIVKRIQTEAKDSAYETVKSTIVQFTNDSEQFITWSNRFPYGFSANCINEIRETTAKTKNIQLDYAWEFLNELRCRNMMLSLLVTNAISCILKIQKSFELLLHQMSEQFIAVVADAGAGKTQFAAELTAPGKNRAAGILILGRYLKKGGTLDMLANRIQFYNEPVKTFRNLLCAVDMAGVRCNCRLPVVIDGLNEAENPRDWKDLLAEILPVLKDYPNVVLICTLRTGERTRLSGYSSFENSENRDSFVKMALPENTRTLYSEGFTEQDIQKVAALYFAYYKIEADVSSFATELFSHPLTLRIFCEATNPKREKQVEVLSFPSSVYSMFQKFVENAAKSVSEMPNLLIFYQKKDVMDAVYFLGEVLWTDNTRSIPEDKFFALYKKKSADWESDIINLLVQEGLLFRDEEERCSYWLSPAYDMLGGYFAADYLLEKYKQNNLSDWINTPECTEKLFGKNERRHQLAEDILKALVALTPARLHGEPLWNAVNGQYKSEVVALSPVIDPKYISQDTVNEFRSFIVQNKMPYDTFHELLKFKYCSSHPFNADFFSSVMKLLSVEERDLSWTEYVHRDFLRRSASAKTKENIQKMQNYWKTGDWSNPERERLRAVYFTWFLTTTCPELRYAITEALFDYGLHEPKKLFAMTLSLLDVNDPYVSERLLAVCYGVSGTIAKEKDNWQTIADFAKQLQNRMFSKNADKATTHILSREYASLLIQIVLHTKPGFFTDDEISSVQPPFPDMPRKTWERVSREGASKYGESPFRMDFENYTLGRLVKDRSNYDFNHAEYREICEKIYWRILDLGWDKTKYESIENSIEQANRNMADIFPKIERYGKKYSWIAYYEMAGIVDDAGKLKKYETGFSRDLDPFFPEVEAHAVKNNFLFLGDSSISTSSWIADESIPDISLTVQKDELKDWILLYADIIEDSPNLSRQMNLSMETYFIKKHAALYLRKQINKKEIRWPEQAETHETYSCEIYASECSKLGRNHMEILKCKRRQIQNVPTIITDDKKIFLSTEPRTIEVPVYHRIDCSQTIFIYTFGFEWGKNSVSYPLLAPWIVKALELDFNPHTLSYTDKNNKPAIVSSVIAKDDYHNRQKLLFLRKDLFEKLHKDGEMKCISRIIGEKSRSYSSENRNSSVPWQYREFENVKEIDSMLHTEKLK